MTELPKPLAKTSDSRHKRALIVGEFSPPHMGDVHIFDFTRNFADEIHVLMLEQHPQSAGIPQKLRLAWLQELCPHATTIKAIPSAEAAEYVQKQAPVPDFILGQDVEYCRKLAADTSSLFVPTNLHLPIWPLHSELNKNPLANWHHLPRCTRPYFVKRVCIFGPESTGKTTLAQNLAREFETVSALEWARSLLDERNNELKESDFLLFARGHRASEEALARAANRVLFSDSDCLTTYLWSHWLFGRCDPLISDLADSQQYDLYLLTDIDVPWVEDPQRYLPNQRQEFFDRCQHELDIRKRPYLIVRGDWETRFSTAKAAINEVLLKA